ncbi:MAG TPA: hypothetical protein VFL69_11215 [Marmoricola sp.]|nr:hypothetical protein [Marmoricola sp.]
MEHWVCDHCGTSGRAPDGDLAEHVQCPMCGEPVTRLPDRASDSRADEGDP